MELADLRNFDYLIFIIISLSTYLAWKKGFIESFVDFFAWVGSGFIVADNYSSMLSFLGGFISSKFICIFMASFCFYVALVILFYVVGNKILKATTKFCGSTPDKIAGIFFGVVRGVIVAMVIFWSCYMILFAWNDEKMPDWFVKAQSYKILKISSDSMVDLITSEEDRQKLFKIIQRKNDNLEDELKKSTAKKSKEMKESINNHSENNFLNNDEDNDDNDF